MKEDIALKEGKIDELEEQIMRLQYMLQDKVGDNDIVLGL